MKKSSAGLVAVVCMLAASAVAAQAPAQPPPAPMWGPAPCGGGYFNVEQLEDGRVTFRLCAPEATTVSVTSSDTPAIPMMGGLPLTRDDKGLWSGTTAVSVPAGTYRYNFSVNGVRVVDPLTTTYSEERVGNNGVFETFGPEGAFQSYDKNIAHGIVSEIEYWSESLGAKRRAHIYTPPGYAKNDASYPVLYLLHGAGDSDDSWTSVGRAHYILDNLIAADKAVPMIVVMPAAHTPDRPGPGGPERMLVNEDFANDFHKDLIPFVDRHFRTVDKPSHRAMAGLSMGGAHTIQNGLPRSDLFDYIGVFSIGLFNEEAAEAYESKHAEALRRGAASFKRVRYYMGKDDFLHNTVAPTRTLLDKYGIAYDYIETEGGHTWINWRLYLADFVPYLFK